MFRKRWKIPPVAEKELIGTIVMLVIFTILKLNSIILSIGFILAIGHLAISALASVDH